MSGPDIFLSRYFEKTPETASHVVFLLRFAPLMWWLIVNHDGVPSFVSSRGIAKGGNKHILWNYLKLIEIKILFFASIPKNTCEVNKYISTTHAKHKKLISWRNFTFFKEEYLFSFLISNEMKGKTFFVKDEVTKNFTNVERYVTTSKWNEIQKLVSWHL